MAGIEKEVGASKSAGSKKSSKKSGGSPEKKVAKAAKRLLK
jgi:hypothetical protein